MTSRKTGGFTLIELLVAMAIFALISALAFGGLNAVVTQQSLAQDRIRGIAQLQRAVRLLTDDFVQLNPRYVRDVLGQASESALVTDALSENVVRLSRGGWRNPVPVPRGTLQRVQYRLEDRELIREYWPVMDHPLGMEPESVTVLKDVDALKIEYLDAQSAWHEQWPPLSQAPDAEFVYPRAVRISLETVAWGEIVRVVDLLE
jgi:general secretion pathway protein J